MIREVHLEHSTWNELPHKFEAGTMNIAQAVGLGAAVDYLDALGMENVREHERRLGEYAYRRLSRLEISSSTAPGRTERASSPSSCRTCIRTTSPSSWTRRA